jgi:hypothetical protein
MQYLFQTPPQMLFDGTELGRLKKLHDNETPAGPVD